MVIVLLQGQVKDTTQKPREPLKGIWLTVGKNGDRGSHVNWAGICFPAVLLASCGASQVLCLCSLHSRWKQELLA
jgi:hypothetical protein